MNNIDLILEKLSKSKFRSSFHLKPKDYSYINDKGLDIVKKHAYDFINQRLKDVTKVNDGKQTPMKGHPVFIAQHACALCCRGCLEKWYHIPKEKILNDEEIDFIVNVIMAWIAKEMNNQSK